MKYFITIFMLVALISTRAIAELTTTDLEKIRGIVKEAVGESETRIKEYVDLKIDPLEKI